MMCAWKELLGILPLSIRKDVDIYGKLSMQELRLRINSPPELVCAEGIFRLTGITSQDDLHYVINAASKYSPWNMNTSAMGYLTAPGGHRIGLCGEAICRNGRFEGIREASSLCIRVSRDYPGISKDIGNRDGSVLILGAPGWGKTTLLRDLARSVAERNHVAVVDERMELFPNGFQKGEYMDVMHGCPKSIGIEILLRTMGPEFIAVDEITAEQDCNALLQAANCGVHLLASAHASSWEEFTMRKIYRPLIENKVFDALLILRKNKTFYLERMAQ